MNKLWMSIGVTSNLLYRPNCENELEGLDHDLAKLELVQVRERVPRGRQRIQFGSTVTTPRLPMSPSKLIQCKHTSSVGKKLRVDLNNELGKCGLLRNDDKVDKNNEMGRVALRAIWFMWSDEYEDHHHLEIAYDGTNKKNRSVSAVEQQESLAFPENVLDSPNTSDDYESAMVSLGNGN